jgi:hypothetical protein
VRSESALTTAYGTEPLCLMYAIWLLSRFSRWRPVEVRSNGLSSEERITVDIEDPGLLFASRAAKRIDRRADPNVD